ncbi:MAG: hypothetical protein ACRC33_11005 [Gemmataceae bacterium]
MRRVLILCLCVLPAALLRGGDPDPEPDGRPDDAIARLDRESAKATKEKAEKARKNLVARLEKLHASLVKAGKADKARELKDRILLAGSIDAAQGLDTKLKVPDLLKEASAKGKYRELLHVLYIPGDRASYTDFRDYGPYSGTSYHGFNDLKTGHWVYHAPRWYIWKEVKP